MHSGFFLAAFLALIPSLHANQKIVLCDKPAKNQPCIIKCITDDFKHPVTFSHPPSRDVGSCDAPYDCGSRYSYYNLSQRVEKNHHITSFQISGLERDRDEGAWRCTYGNTPSQTVDLVVHTSPLTVNISKNESDATKLLLIQCLCYCVYPSDYTAVKIKVRNKIIERNLETLREVINPPDKYGCQKDERVVLGSVSIFRKDWYGIDIDVNCGCYESKLSHMAEKNSTFKLLGFKPDPPHHFKLNSSGTDYLAFSWKKGFNGGYKQLFVIEYNSTMQNGPFEPIIVEEERVKSYYVARINELKPNSMYSVWIYSKNVLGRSVFSGSFNFNTSAVTFPDVEGALSTWIIIVIVPVIILAFIIAITICILIWRRKFRNRRKRQGVNGIHRQEDGVNERLLPQNGVDAIELPTIPDTAQGPPYIPDIEGLSSLAKGALGRTKQTIEKVNKSKTFVATRGFLASLNSLCNNNILVYTGTEKDGRFTCAIHLMNVLETKYGYYPIILNDITIWRKVVNQDIKMVVLVQKILKFRAVIKEYVEDIMQYTNLGKTKVIICDPIKEQEMSELSKNIELFSERYHIHLSGEKYNLTINEKKEIFKKHCLANKIELCTKIQDENLGNRGGELKVSFETIEKIVQTNSVNGFVQTSIAFCKRRDYLKMGVDFFTQSQGKLKRRYKETVSLVP